MEGKFFIPASERGEIEKVFYAWAELALRRRNLPCLPIWEAWTTKNISAWANQVLAEAEEEERDMRPIAHISFQKGVLSLHWEGTFTEGRKISLYLHESGDIEGNFKTGDGKAVLVSQGVPLLLPEMASCILRGLPRRIQPRKLSCLGAGQLNHFGEKPGDHA